MTLEQRIDATAKALKEHGASVSEILIADLLIEAGKRLGYYSNEIMALRAELNEQNLHTDNA